MTATRSTATLPPRPLPRPGHAPPTAACLLGSGSSLPEPRQELLDRAAALFSQARQAAGAGDLAESARLILEGLDCERRVGGLGPQVLQLIKPRH